MRSGNTVEDLKKPGIDPYPATPDPLIVLQEHIVVNDLRIIDILKQYDTEKTLFVTKEQFADALEVCTRNFKSEFTHEEVMIKYVKPDRKIVSTKSLEKCIIFSSRFHLDDQPIHDF